MPIPSTKHIVITGVSRGLGAALATWLAQRGHIVSGCSRTSPKSCVKQSNLEIATPVDVADDAQVAAWAGGILGRHGAPDLLVNNAAVINRNAPLWEVSADDIRRIVEINVLGVANVIRHFVPAMIAKGTGVIVNLSSYWGRSTAAEVAPYCATKFAVEGLTRALAQELPKKLAAVALNPGVIDTDMLRSCFGDAAGSYETPESWVDAAAPFLLELGPEHNGQSLTVPGQ